ncbi:GNAT family N-acetyltransferase [Nocardia thailandica]
MTGAVDTAIGPARTGGRSIRLRPLRLDDAGEWRRIRMRDERRLRPVTATSPHGWPDRHHDRAWAAEWWSARRDARAGRRYAYVIEVDGRFAGQCQLGSVATHTGTAELGLWLDSAHAGGGIAGTAVALLLDAGFTAVGLHRVTAPIAVGNTVVAAGAASLGMRHEATLTRYFDADGARRDHQLWAITRPEMPDGGFTAAWTRRPHRSTRPDPAGLATDGHDRAGHRDPAAGVPVGTVARVVLRQTAGAVRRRCRGWIPGPRTVLVAAPGVTLAGERCADLASRRGRLFTVVREGDLLGFCRLFGRDMFDRNLSAELIPLTPAFGAALRADVLRALRHHASDDLGVVRLTLLVPTADGTTTAAAGPAGFAAEGTLRDVRDHTGAHGDVAVWAWLIPEPR